MLCLSTDADIDSPGGQLQQLHQPNFIQPIFFNNQGDMPRGPQGWPKSQSPTSFHVQSAQSAIANGRASVSQQYGQITPPDEYSTSEDAGSAFNLTQPEQAGNSKSERARNAANQRHAKAKKARKDSVRSKGESPADEDVRGSGVDKREKYREKNRLAAAKCRAKKKTHTDDLEESARNITATNNRLRAEERELRDLFSSLRNQALAHDPTQGCTCTAIHTYNHHKAQEAARGAAMSFGVMASPPMGSDEPSRAQSFSGARPSMHAMQSSNLGRTPSLAGQAGFVPPRLDDNMMLHQDSISPDASGEDLSEFSAKF